MFIFGTIRIKSKVNRVIILISLVKVVNQLNVQVHQALLLIQIRISNNTKIGCLRFHLKILKAFYLTLEEVVFLGKRNKLKAIKSKITNSINRIIVLPQKRLVLWINWQLLKILKRLLF